MSLPHLTEPHGVCPVLEDVLGIVDGDNRWQEFLSAGSRTAREFHLAWDNLQTEISHYTAYLEMETDLPLADNVQQAGGQSTDGNTRRRLVEQRELLRHQVLTKALQDHHDRGGATQLHQDHHDRGGYPASSRPPWQRGCYPTS